MKDDFFTATTDWAPVAANGSDITNGTFSVYGNGTRRVDFFVSEIEPTVDFSYAYFSPKVKSFKYNLGIGEKLWCKTHSIDETFLVNTA